MKVEVTYGAAVRCKDLMKEAYEAAHKRFPGRFTGFGGLNALWEEVEATLKMDLSTTREEDNQAMDIMAEVFEEACRAAAKDGIHGCDSDYVDYQRLWEQLCEVLGVKV